MASANRDDVDKAVAVAKTAFYRGWKTTTAAARSKLLLKLADLVERDAEIFATIESVDAGVLFEESRNLNVQQAVHTLRFFAHAVSVHHGSLIDVPEGYAYTRHEPYGVAAAIVPWNAPLMITTWKLAPAIAAGNVLVIKSPELAPVYGQHLAKLIVEAGFPPGVVNIVCGLGPVAGQSLAEHRDVRKLAFTGSGNTGRRILKAAADSNLKKVTVELGGKGPSIVFDDADIENALFWTKLGSTAHNGQVCALGSRIYVQNTIYDEFLQEFLSKSAKTPAVPGDPLKEGTTKGPLISSEQADKVLAHIEGAEAEGARILMGGKRIPQAGTSFVEDTLISATSEEAAIVKDEVFGPVATIKKFSSEDEALRLANDSEFGLNAAIFTKSSARAHRISTGLECGTVTVNCWGLLHAATPFGGVKQSGFGRDMGVEALNEWTTTKTVKYFITGLE